MHQYKIVAQILLIFSIFNLVLAAPVVRDIYDACDDVAVPTAVGNVAVMSKERHQSRSDEATASPSSPPSSDGEGSLHGLPTLPHVPASLYDSSSSDGEGSLHGLPTPPHVPASLYDSSSSDGEGSLHELPTHPDEPTSSAVSSPSGEIVPVGSPSVSQGDADAVDRLMMEAGLRTDQDFRNYRNKIVSGVAVLTIAGIAIGYSQLHNHHHRTIDRDWYVSDPSRPSCRRLKVPNHKRSDL
jgi:hypothetical protein